MTETIYLWDGKEYDEADLARRLAWLPEYARNNYSLTETMEATIRFNREFLLGLLVVVVFSAATSVYATVIGFSWRSTMPYCIGMTAAGVILLTCRWTRANREFPRTITVCRGDVIVRDPKRTKTYKLDECWWFDGTSFDDQSSIVLGRRRATIILVFPPSCNDFTAGQVWLRRYSHYFGGRIACGLTPQTLELWRTFLLLAEVSQGRSRRRGLCRIQKRRACHVCQNDTIHRLVIPASWFRGTVLKQWRCAQCENVREY